MSNKSQKKRFLHPSNFGEGRVANPSFNSVELIPDLKASAAFTVNSSEVFKESEDITPVIIDKDLSYMPWGADNNLPYRVLDLIESDETLSTCQLFNAEVCYGSGLVYDSTAAKKKVQEQVDDFLMDNDLPSYFLGVCQDFKHFAFCVSVIILNADGSKIVRLLRKEACYCRFAEADKHGSYKHSSPNPPFRKSSRKKGNRSCGC